MSNIRKARIAYSGSAIVDGEMDVRELAPALIAFSDLVSSINKVLDGTKEIKVMLNQNSIRRGSFDITFILNESLLEQARLFLEGTRDTALDDIMRILGYGVVGAESFQGIFWLIKRIRSKIKAIKHKEKEKVEISMVDGSVIETDEKTLKVFLDVECRLNIERVIKPVTEIGIESFELRNPDERDDNTPLVAVHKGDVELFRAPEAAENKMEELPVPVQQELLVKIVSVNFELGKWRFSDNSNPAFWATIADKDFIKRVENREIAFSSGDMLRIKYRHVQSIKNGTLSSEYIVDKVVEYKEAPKQIKLDFEYEEK